MQTGCAAPHLASSAWRPLWVPFWQVLAAPLHAGQQSWIPVSHRSPCLSQAGCLPHLSKGRGKAAQQEEKEEHEHEEEEVAGHWHSGQVRLAAVLLEKAVLKGEAES